MKAGRAIFQCKLMPLGDESMQSEGCRSVSKIAALVRAGNMRIKGLCKTHSDGIINRASEKV